MILTIVIVWRDSLNFQKVRGSRKNLELESQWGGLSRFFAPRTTPGAQPSIKSSMCSNEMIVKAKMAVARWWYDANLPFNAAQSKFYQPAIDAMTAIGPGFKGPSLYELRGNLLKMAVNEVQDYLQQIKKIWNETGCSLMADGWTNQKQQSIINFLVYCPKGTMFLKSVDTFGLRKDAETLFNIFDEVVQEIGAENLVQFITDNDASYKAAGKKLQQNHSKSSIGKEIAEIVLEDKEFWVQCQFIVKVSEPLVRVLRLVDGDEKPAM
ncbi:hypothetical protein F2P56_002142 [Juglans regia]|uniref:DUF659 domain-containing protein n=1 Tax=Juglans regia TaxID=51240 RepID=A0A833YBR9_JUGRE|nr:hypothetical protein F2P56_002142 [Juglans regia]